MGDVVEFPAAKEPMDDVEVCSIAVTGDGRVSLWVHNYIESVEQYNWLIAKLTAAASALIDRKVEVLERK